MEVVRTEVNDLIRKMSRAGNKEASKKVKSLQLGSDFDQIMPHYQTETETFQQDMEVAKQAISGAYELDMFLMKSTGELARLVCFSSLDQSCY